MLPPKLEAGKVSRQALDIYWTWPGHVPKPFHTFAPGGGTWYWLVTFAILPGAVPSLTRSA